MLLARSDQGIGEQDVSALKITRRSGLPQYIALCCPELEHHDIVRLETFVRDVLQSEGVNATVVSSDPHNPLSFWNTASASIRSELIRNAHIRSDTDRRDRQLDAIQREITSINASLKDYARIRLACDAIAESHARKREAIERLRKAAFDDVATTSLQGRASVLVDQASLTRADTAQALTEHVHLALGRYLDTWSQSIIETFLAGVARDAELVLRLPTDTAAPAFEFEVSSPRDASVAQMIRYGAGGLSIATVASIIGISVPPLIIIPAALALGGYLFHFQRNEESRTKFLRDVSPYVHESCIKYCTFTRDLITRLCTLATEQLLRSTNAAQAPLLSLPGAIADDEALILVQKRLQLTSSCSS